MEKVKFNIPKIDRIIKLLGNVYSDPRDALSEFIVNSLDANATLIKIIINKGKKNKIIVQDNGVGMDYNEMVRVVKNIGNSIKLNPEELVKRSIDAKKVIGHMGIGILGYQSFCKRAIFVSKSKTCKDIWSMQMEINDVEVKINKLEDKNLIIDQTGTTVILEEISPEIMRIFNISFLNQYLQKNFSEILRTRKKIKIILKDRKTEVMVKPYPFSGIPFSKNFIYTKNSNLINLNIYIQPSGTNENLSISTKGKVVVKDIIRLAEFQYSPWSDGILHGIIEADFLKITPARDNYIRDSNFYSFCEALKSIEAQLKEEIKKVKDAHLSQKREDIINKLSKAVTKALRELELEGSKIKVKNSKGSEDIGLVTNDTIPHELGKKPRKETHNIIEGIEKSKVKISYRRGGLNLKWDHLGNPKLHSILKEGGLIIINEDAEDYKEAITSAKREIKYLAKLVAKELSKYNNPYANTDDVMEQAISLELKILRFLNLF